MCLDYTAWDNCRSIVITPEIQQVTAKYLAIMNDSQNGLTEYSKITIEESKAFFSILHFIVQS